MTDSRIWSLTDKPLSWGLAVAIAAGTADPIAWIDVDLPALDLRVTTTTDALRMPLSWRDPSGGVQTRSLRVSVSDAELRRIARSLGCVLSTAEIVRALIAADPHRVKPKPLTFTAHDLAEMGSLAYLIRENDALEAQLDGTPGDLIDVGFDKTWIDDPLMLRHGACNFGFVELSGHEIQAPGGAHGTGHLDYSQAAASLLKRIAIRISTGDEVDLLELRRARWPQMSKIWDAYGDLDSGPDTEPAPAAA